MFHCCSKGTNFWENVETQYFASRGAFSPCHNLRSLKVRMVPAVNSGRPTESQCSRRGRKVRGRCGTPSGNTCRRSSSRPHAEPDSTPMEVPLANFSSFGFAKGWLSCRAKPNVLKCAVGCLFTMRHNVFSYEKLAITETKTVCHH